MLRKQFFLSIAMVLLCTVHGLAAGNFATQLKKGWKLCTNKQFAEAEQIYLELLRKSEGERKFEVRRKLAAALASQADKQHEAKGAVEQILGEYGQHEQLPYAIYEIARSCYKYGQVKNVREIYAQILQEKPGRADAIWLVTGLAIADMYAGESDTARENIEKLLNDYSKDDRVNDALVQVAKCYLNTKDYEKARELYRYVIDREPKSTAAKQSYAGLARACIAADDLQGAKDITGRLLANAEENISGTSQALFDIGYAYYQEAGRIQFKNQLDKWKVLQDGTIDVWASLMKFAESHEVDSEMLANTYHFSGHTHRNLGQYAEAARCYKVVLERWPDYRYAGETQFQVASCLEAMGEESDANGTNANAAAEEAYKSVINKYPGCTMVGFAYRNLGIICERSGRKDEAIENYEKALSVGTFPEFVAKSINKAISGLSENDLNKSGSEKKYQSEISKRKSHYSVPEMNELMRRFTNRDTAPIHGRVLNENGENVKHATVLLYSGDEYVKGDVSMKDGSYAIGDLPAGTYDLHVSVDGYQERIEKGVEVPENGSIKLDITLEGEGSISGVVTKSDGVTSVEDVIVMAEDSSGFSRLEMTDANGSYKIGKLASGTYTVSANDEDCSFADHKNVIVTKGQTTSNINFAGIDGKITGIITKSDGSTPLGDCMVCAIDSSGDTAGIGKTDENGKFELSGLASGSYTVFGAYKERSLGTIALVRHVSVTNGEITNFNLSAGSTSGIFKDWKQGSTAETSIRLMSFCQNVLLRCKDWMNVQK